MKSSGVSVMLVPVPEEATMPGNQLYMLVGSGSKDFEFYRFAQNISYRMKM